MAPASVVPPPYMAPQLPTKTVMITRFCAIASGLIIPDSRQRNTIETGLSVLAALLCTRHLNDYCMACTTRSYMSVLRNCRPDVIFILFYPISIHPLDLPLSGSVLAIAAQRKHVDPARASVGPYVEDERPLGA